MGAVGLGVAIVQISVAMSPAVAGRRVSVADPGSNASRVVTDQALLVALLGVIVIHTGNLDTVLEFITVRALVLGGSCPFAVPFWLGVVALSAGRKRSVSWHGIIGRPCFLDDLSVRTAGIFGVCLLAHTISLNILVVLLDRLFPSDYAAGGSPTIHNRVVRAGYARHSTGCSSVVAPSSFSIDIAVCVLVIVGVVVGEHPIVDLAQLAWHGAIGSDQSEARGTVGVDFSLGPSAKFLGVPTRHFVKVTTTPNLGDAFALLAASQMTRYMGVVVRRCAQE